MGRCGHVGNACMLPPCRCMFASVTYCSLKHYHICACLKSTTEVPLSKANQGQSHLFRGLLSPILPSLESSILLNSLTGHWRWSGAACKAAASQTFLLTFFSWVGLAVCSCAGVTACSQKIMLENYETACKQPSRNFQIFKFPVWR